MTATRYFVDRLRGFANEYALHILTPVNAGLPPPAAWERITRAEWLARARRKGDDLTSYYITCTVDGREVWRRSAVRWLVSGVPW